MNRPNPGPPPNMVKAFPLGDSGFALVGGGPGMEYDPDKEELVFTVGVAGGRISEIVGLTPVRVELREVARVPIGDVVAALQAKEAEDANAALAGMPRAMG